MLIAAALYTNTFISTRDWIVAVWCIWCSFSLKSSIESGADALQRGHSSSFRPTLENHIFTVLTSCTGVLSCLGFLVSVKDSLNQIVRTQWHQWRLSLLHIHVISLIILYYRQCKYCICILSIFLGTKQAVVCRLIYYLKSSWHLFSLWHRCYKTA